jgi:CubicO group peptidase (beta-lactamase class C family)
MSALPEALQAKLDRRVRQVQCEQRVPGLAVGVMRGGELIWFTGVGAADVGSSAAPTADTAFAIGSISKTFTAVLVLMLRDEGRLALDDPLGKFLPDQQHSAVTIRELLVHASGLQREPVGDVWVSLEMPSIDEVVARLDDAERVLPSRLRWHYSNLAYSLLGEVVARVDGRPWPDALKARLLDPLGMTRTSLTPDAPRAVGYYTEPYTDQVSPEPWIQLAGFSAAGGLWSTVRDLARWAAFLVDGADDVLSQRTLDEMARPEIMADLDTWTLAWGLGIALYRSGDRVLAGHGGAMPGFLAGLAARRVDRTAAVVLANTTAGVDAPGLAVELVCTALDEDPAPAETWCPGPPVPPELAPLVGRWWSEGNSFTFSVRDAKLEARLDSAPADKPPAVFEPAGPDLFRTVSGREEGEQLRVLRDDAGAVAQLLWATYPFTREPKTFG